MRTTTYQQALYDGEISLEIPVYDSQDVLVSQKGVIDLSSSPAPIGKENKQSDKSGVNECAHPINLAAFGDEYFIFRDMFGKVSQFLRAYTHKTIDCKVRILPHAYAYTHQEIVFTKSKKALISYGAQRKHPFGPSLPNSSRLRRIADFIRLIARWMQFYFSVPFARRYNASVALLTKESELRHYGHFVKEMLAGYYQLKLAKKEPDFYILPLEMPFQKQVCELLNIDLSRVIPSHTRKLIHAKELIVPTLIADYEIVEYRKYMHTNTHILPLFTYTMHKELFYDILAPTQHTKPYRKIYLARPTGSNRNFTNHEEIESVMQQYGFEIVVPDFLSVREQILMMSEVACVVSMHGAGLNNLFFAKEGTKVLEIFSQYYHDRGVQLVALAKQCEYHYIIAETLDTSMHPQQECAYISPDMLHLALDRLLSK